MVSQKFALRLMVSMNIYMVGRPSRLEFPVFPVHTPSHPPCSIPEILCSLRICLHASCHRFKLRHKRQEEEEGKRPRASVSPIDGHGKVRIVTFGAVVRSCTDSLRGFTAQNQKVYRIVTIFHCFIRFDFVCLLRLQVIAQYSRIAQWFHRSQSPFINWREVFFIGTTSTAKEIAAAKAAGEGPGVAEGEQVDGADARDEEDGVASGGEGEDEASAPSTSSESFDSALTPTRLTAFTGFF